MDQDSGGVDYWLQSRVSKFLKLLSDRFFDYFACALFAGEQAFSPGGYLIADEGNYERLGEIYRVCELVREWLNWWQDFQCGRHSELGTWKVICAVVVAIWGDSKFCFGVGDIIGATSVTCVEGFSCTGKLASVAFPVNV